MLYARNTSRPGSPTHLVERPKHGGDYRRTLCGVRLVSPEMMRGRVNDGIGESRYPTGVVHVPHSLGNQCERCRTIFELRHKRKAKR